MAKIRNFDQMSETAKWLVCNMLTRVSKQVWELSPDGQPDIEIFINGHEIENLNEMFEHWAAAMDGCAGSLAAEKVLEQFHLTTGGIYDTLQDIEDQLKAELRAIFSLSKSDDW